MNTVKKRIVSLDLLRIISMIMIIAYHWQLHAYNDGIRNSGLSLNQIFTFIIGSWGTLGVDLFFMISAYFLVQSSAVKGKKIFSLICKASTYGTVVLFFAYLGEVEKFSILGTIKSLLGVMAYQYWFIVVYCIVYLLSPCLNLIIYSVSEKYFILLLFVILYGTFILSFIFGNEILGRAGVGISIYFIIGFLTRFPQYNIFENYRLAGTMVTLIGTVLLEILLSYFGMRYNSIFNKFINRIQITQSPSMLITALFVFYLFINWKVKPSKILSFLSSYSVGAYLLHGGPSFLRKWLWDDFFKAGVFYEKHFFEYAFHYINCIVFLFMFGVICEFLYMKTVDRFIMSKLKYEIWNKKIDIHIGGE